MDDFPLDPFTIFEEECIIVGAVRRVKLRWMQNDGTGNGKDCVIERIDFSGRLCAHGKVVKRTGPPPVDRLRAEGRAGVHQTDGKKRIVVFHNYVFVCGVCVMLLVLQRKAEEREQTVIIKCCAFQISYGDVNMVNNRLHKIFTYPSRSSWRYCSASINSPGPMTSAPFMSATVRATRRMRS